MLNDYLPKDLINIVHDNLETKESCKEKYDNVMNLLEYFVYKKIYQGSPEYLSMAEGCCVKTKSYGEYKFYDIESVCKKCYQNMKNKFHEDNEYNLKYNFSRDILRTIIIKNNKIKRWNESIKKWNEENKENA